MSNDDLNDRFFIVFLLRSVAVLRLELVGTGFRRPLFLSPALNMTGDRVFLFPLTVA